MAFSISISHTHLLRNPSSIHFSPSILSILSYRIPFLHSRFCALKTGSDGGRIRSQDAFGSDLLRKPVVSPVDAAGETEEEAAAAEEEVERNGKQKKRRGKKVEEEDWVDWEDQILEDTVPLVGFVRMILHSEKYASGDRLTPEHEKTIVERLLPFHPECEKKIGCGIDYITVGYHPDFETSRCMFIVRKDGELVDFSYWKCIKGLIRKNYPLYADSFILRHFRRRRRE